MYSHDSCTNAWFLYFLAISSWQQVHDMKSHTVHTQTPTERVKKISPEISFLCPYWPAEIASLFALCAVPPAVSLCVLMCVCGYVCVSAAMDISLCCILACRSTRTLYTTQKTLYKTGTHNTLVRVQHRLAASYFSGTLLINQRICSVKSGQWRHGKYNPVMSYTVRIFIGDV